MRAIGGMAVLLVLSTSLALAQNYPTRPVRAIVPFPSGQGADILMRMLAEHMSREFGQQIVVDNRPGAGGTTGTALAARAAPDGYTLYMGSSGPLAISPSIYPNPGYDPVKSFAPISNIASVAQVLVTAPGGSLKSASQMLQLARRGGGEMQYASPGSGTTSHLTMELLLQMAGIKMSHVPYKGSPPAHLDVIAGRVPVMFDSTPGVLPHIRSARLRALAVSTGKRISFLPDVPTINESGVKDFNTMGWIGLLAPAGMPKAIVERLHRSIVAMIRSPEVLRRFDDLAFSPVGDTPSEFGIYIRKEVELWSKVVKISGAKME